MDHTDDLETVMLRLLLAQGYSREDAVLCARIRMHQKTPKENLAWIKKQESYFEPMNRY